MATSDIGAHLFHSFLESVVILHISFINVVTAGKHALPHLPYLDTMKIHTQIQRVIP